MTALFRNRKFRELVLQASVVAAVAAILIAMVLNARASLEAQGMTSGFSFLGWTTGWDISFSVLPYTISDTYARTLLIGLLNTLLLGILGIFFATLIGIFIGLVRTSSNYLFSLLGTIYVEIFRNVPLILQAVFWYAIVSHLPRPRSAINFFDSIFLSGRGLYFPVMNISLTAVFIALGLFVGWMMVLLFSRERLQLAGIYRVFRNTGWILVLLAVIVILFYGRLADTPLWDVPARKGLNFRGGMRVTPELSALIIAISLYGGAYIGEVVRAGLISVPKGQIEAGMMTGLKPFHIFTRVRLPLAVRNVLPSLTNQYVQLMKGTTIGLAIGFSDYFMIISTSINQSGQTLELIALLMGGFLLINLSIAFIMNTINRRLALKGYEVKS